MRNNQKKKISIIFLVTVFGLYGCYLFLSRHISLHDLFIHVGSLILYVVIASIVSIIIAMIISYIWTRLQK